MTDNAKTFQSKCFQRALRWLGTRHKTTPPYTPKVNGKVERFIRTLLNAWGMLIPTPAPWRGTPTYPKSLHFYNWRRPHSCFDNEATFPLGA